MKKYYMHKINNLIVIKKIVTIHYQELPSGYIFNGESHDFWEMAYVDKNQVIYQLDNEIIVNQGEIIFIKPNTFHSLRCNKDANLLVISFECSSSIMSYFIGQKMTVRRENIELLSQIINEAKHTFILPKFAPELRKLELSNNPSLGGEQLIKNYLEIFLIKQLRNEVEKSKGSIAFISKINSSNKIEDIIIKILNDNLYNKITLDDICSKLGYGKTFICTTFKNNTQTTIIDYYLNLKIEEAKTMIIRGKSFSEISELLAFDSLSHFTHTFKKRTNMTPMQYKKSIQYKKDL